MLFETMLEQLIKSGKVIDDNIYIGKTGFEGLFEISKEKLVQNYRKNQILYRENSEATGIYYIKQGVIKISRKSVSGKDTALRYTSAGYIIGIPEAIRNTLHPASASAFENSKVYFLAVEHLKKYIKENPAIAQQIAIILCDMEENSVAQLNNYYEQDPSVKIAETLLILKKNEKKGLTRLTLLVTAKDLSKLTGIREEIVTDVLQKMKKQKFIRLKCDHIELLDCKALEKTIKSK